MTTSPTPPAAVPTAVPAELRSYLDELVARVRSVIGDDLAGVWLIGSASLGGYEHGVSDVDVLAVSGRRADEATRLRLADRIAHPTLPCPAVGLEFVWYAVDDLDPLPDPVVFQLNVNGGPKRAAAVQLHAEGDTWWAPLDIAGARAIGIPLAGPAAADVIPELPRQALTSAITASVGWHGDADAGSPNRALNLARLVLLLADGAWVSKPESARQLGGRRPDLAPALAEAVRARAEGRWMDPALIQPIHDEVARLLTFDAVS